MWGEGVVKIVFTRSLCPDPSPSIVASAGLQCGNFIGRAQVGSVPALDIKKERPKVPPFLDRAGPKGVSSKGVSIKRSNLPNFRAFRTGVSKRNVQKSPWSWIPLLRKPFRSLPIWGPPPLYKAPPKTISPSKTQIDTLQLGRGRGDFCVVPYENCRLEVSPIPFWRGSIWLLEAEIVLGALFKKGETPQRRHFGFPPVCRSGDWPDLHLSSLDRFRATLQPPLRILHLFLNWQEASITWCDVFRPKFAQKTAKIITSHDVLEPLEQVLSGRSCRGFSHLVADAGCPLNRGYLILSWTYGVVAHAGHRKIRVTNLHLRGAVLLCPWERLALSQSVGINPNSSCSRKHQAPSFHLRFWRNDKWILTNQMFTMVLLCALACLWNARIKVSLIAKPSWPTMLQS